ncbi:Glycosyl transferase family 2 [Rhizobiales bacterium GAS113]|nr:Glycosyl transferase family 2 [Rhizobiales bacterium GAS113]
MAANNTVDERAASPLASHARPAGRVALVIPTLNEEEAIGPLLARVPAGGVDTIIVADGGSTDRTAERAGALGATVIDAGRGYGRACWQGALTAGDDCEILVFMDGDGADKPELIARLTAPIAAGTVDFVIGSRLRGRREAGSMSGHQIAAGLALGYAMRLAYGVRYTDMCAFRAIRRSSLMALGMREMTYGWNIEMQMRAAAAKLRILEIPVDYGLREGGVSKVAGSLRGTLRAGTRIIATFLRVWRETRGRRRMAR